MPAPCWRCRESVQGPVCPGCGAVQPPPADPDWFLVLGLPRRFHLADAEVDEAWRLRSRAVHPDRHVTGAALERRMSLQWTALVNEARRVLRDPFARGGYLATGKATAVEAGGPGLEPEFLEKVFDWRMALEGGEEAVSAKREVREAWDALLSGFDALFLAWEEGRGDLSQVPTYLARIRALKNLVELL